MIKQLKPPFNASIRLNDKCGVVMDADGVVIATTALWMTIAERELYSQAICDALNNYVNNNTRRTDPSTSRKAEMKMSDALKNRHRNAAYAYLRAFGPLTDEQLYLKFVEAGVAISEARVRHIRLELQRFGIVRTCPSLTAKNSSGNDVTVYAARNLNLEDPVQVQ